MGRFVKAAAGRLVLPLNLEHNAHSTFRDELAAIRAQCRRRADINMEPGSVGR